MYKHQIRIMIIMCFSLPFAFTMCPLNVKRNRASLLFTQPEQASAKESWDATWQQIKPQERPLKWDICPKSMANGRPSGRYAIQENRDCTQESCTYISLTLALHTIPPGANLTENPRLCLKIYNCPMSWKHNIFSNLLHARGLATKTKPNRTKTKKQRCSYN